MRIVLFLCALAFALKGSGQSWKDFKYRTGDLLFQDLDCGELCDAIEAVTPTVGDKHFSHVGIAYVLGDSVFVIEAMGKDVHLTSLSQFINRQLDIRQQPKVIVGRLKPAYERLNARAVGFALQQIGKPYDELFLYGNGKYYCSELVYDAYMAANDGRAVFNLYPMTFKNPETGKTFPAWKKYYRQLKADIPEGREGCNPASIALSNTVAIVASFY